MLLRDADGSRGAAPARVADAVQQSPAADVEWYVCLRCAERLARSDWTLDEVSALPLVFVNPHGNIFQLLLVSRVQSAFFEGTPTEEFTWFEGYAWSVGFCSSCRLHIGWHFAARRAGAALREFVALSRAALRLARCE
jgi:hypothetical protein